MKHMNEKYELYCKVLVKTGETGIIVESYNDGEAYEIERIRKLNLRLHNYTTI